MLEKMAWFLKSWKRKGEIRFLVTHILTDEVGISVTSEKAAGILFCVVGI